MKLEQLDILFLSLFLFCEVIEISTIRGFRRVLLLERKTQQMTKN